MVAIWDTDEQVLRAGVDLVLDVPRPGIVVGDQVATDGVLARRLGAGFAHVQYARYSPPRGPRVMRQIGRPLRGWLFS